MKKFCKERICDLAIKADGSIAWTVIATYIDGFKTKTYWRTFEGGCGLAYWMINVGWVQKKAPGAWKITSKNQTGIRREIRKQLELK